MIFRETGLKDARLIDLTTRGDERGFFARLFCENEFGSAGLETDFVQINTSLSAKAGTLRGMHYQLMPSAEVKVVRCIRGALWDCIVDLRPHSPTFGKWFGATLSAENRTMLYVPRGFAHGFITLTDDVEALYLVSAFYAPEQERGLRWDDPFFAIEWPCQPVEISAKDGSWPSFDPDYHGVEGFRSLAGAPALSNGASVHGAPA
ncbi:dTDP-4-dehydrorhamnose 3,5-epimerase [Phyllobacterium salinisoli]|uniref:dTDP-4-dehydrorhamnose 3,5-epimerase n=1 Tax=Phyllobacterium salinisoli TaxID=1899321 RepID=A0A368KB70_9HYPH|nr:dTDP-4-dehydrorhamnose 3,5-epimerase [Phyllobacterium salinisoli]RCS25662.1 dTDP-4-dehydrorhamnose 3,5-epimerase [Phyllobacterium salinisoli]